MTNGTIFNAKPNGVVLPDGHEGHGGKVIGFVGAPGIGKGFITRQLRADHPELKFLWRMTTRESRETDSQEGVRAVTREEFESEREHLIAVHAPFPNRPITNGWYVNGAVDGVKKGEHYITDPFIGLLHEFSDRFEGNIHMVGLVADADYITYNMQERVRKLKGGISQSDIDDIKSRRDAGIQVTEQVKEAHRQGLLQSVIEVNFNTRDVLMDEVKRDLARNTNLYVAEGSIRQEAAQRPMVEAMYTPNYYARR